MKKCIFLILGLLIVFGCSEKTPELAYPPETMEYQFFTIISDSMDIPDLNPQLAIPLIKTKAFTVYSSEIMEEVYYTLKPYSASGRKPTKEQVINLYQGAAQNRAGHKLLLTDAKKKSISVSDEEVEKELEKVIENVGGEQTFFQRLQQQNKTVEDFKKQIREFTTIKEYLDEMYYTQVEIDEDTLQDLTVGDKSATVRHILFLTQNKTTAQKEAIRSKAEQILARAKKGEDFAELASTYSEDPGSKDKGGLYEDFEKGTMVKPFEDASFNLPVGSISDLVETRYGFHIIKVVDRKKDERSLDEVKKEAYIQLARKKDPNLVRNLIDQLKEKYEYQELFSIAKG